MILKKTNDILNEIRIIGPTEIKRNEIKREQIEKAIKNLAEANAIKIKLFSNRTPSDKEIQKFIEEAKNMSNEDLIEVCDKILLYATEHKKRMTQKESNIIHELYASRNIFKTLKI